MAHFSTFNAIFCPNFCTKFFSFHSVCATLLLLKLCCILHIPQLVWLLVQSFAHFNLSFFCFSDRTVPNYSWWFQNRSNVKNINIDIYHFFRLQIEFKQIVKYDHSLICFLDKKICIGLPRELKKLWNWLKIDLLSQPQLNLNSTQKSVVTWKWL